MGILSAIKNALHFPAFGGQGLMRGGIDAWLYHYAGQPYNYREAAGPLHLNGVVMACAAWIMRAFPEPPIQVVKEDEKGEANEVPKHALTLAFRKPNPFYGADCLWQRLVFDRAIHGQAYLYKERNERGKVTALWHVPQHRLMPQWASSGKEFINHYLFTVDARQEKVPVEDLVHLRFGGDPDHERNGLASLGAGLREIGALNEGANYRGQLLKNMGVPSHLLQSKDPTKPIQPDQAKELHRLWAERVSGTQRGKPIIPNFALEAIKIGMSPAELDLGSMNYEAADLVCGLFGLSAMVVGLSSGTAHKTYSNFPEAREAAVETCLVPAWKQIAQDLTLHLLPDFSDDEDEQVEFCLDNVRALQEDQSQVWARVVNAYEKQVIDRYRALQGIGMKPEDADKGIYYQRGGGVEAGAAPESAGDQGSVPVPPAGGTNGNGKVPPQLVTSP